MHALVQRGERARRRRERKLAGEELVQHRAERVDVDRRRELAAFCLLGSDVRRRAEDEAGLGHGRGGAGQDLGDAPSDRMIVGNAENQTLLAGKQSHVESTLSLKKPQCTAIGGQNPH